MTSLPEDSKVCTKCKVSKPKSEFGKYKRTKDGLRHYCKQCRNSIEAVYRENNWDDIYKRKRESRLRNLESARESARKWAKKDRELNAAKHKERYANDPEYRRAILNRTKRWRESNPEKNAMKTMRRYAKKMQVKVEDFSTEEVLTKWGTDCHICSEAIDLNAPRNCRGDNWEMGLHLEHVIPINNGGLHSLQNVKPSHAICNLRKGH